MTAAERRDQLIMILLRDRMSTMKRLAAELGCCIRTIFTDIETLSRNFPLVMTRGNQGGVKLADWYHPHRSCLCPQQYDLLIKYLNSASGEERIILNSIIYQFSPTRR